MRQLATAVVEKPLAKLLRKDLGPLGFTEIEPALQPVWDLSSLLLEADLSAYPESYAQDLVQRFGQFESETPALAMFRIDQSIPPAPQRERTIQGLSKVTPLLVAKLLEAVSFGLAAKKAASVPDVAASMRREVDAVMDTIRSTQVFAFQAADAIQKAATKAGVGAEATHFNGRADGHRLWGFVWLAVTIGLGVVATWYAYALAFKPDFVPAVSDQNNHLFYVQVVGRLILGSVLLWALVSAQRNYKAHRHNEVLNRHRAIALTTFETFVKGASDPDTKNAVLLQTTQAIFAVQPTAYLSSEPEPVPQTTLIEVLRRIGDKP